MKGLLCILLVSLSLACAGPRQVDRMPKTMLIGLIQVEFERFYPVKVRCFAEMV